MKIRVGEVITVLVNGEPKNTLVAEVLTHGVLALSLEDSCILSDNMIIHNGYFKRAE